MLLREYLAHILTTFRVNVASVHELMRFDSNVLDFALAHLYSLNGRLMAVHGDNARMTATNTISMLENIRTNASLQPHYRLMLNQCNVLLVSYFSSALGDIFKAGVIDAVRNGGRPTILDEEIKIKLQAVREIGSELVERSGELLTEHREISFQNMQNVPKTFKEYFGYDRKQDEVVNDLILSHACRHVIVHCGGIADRKMIGHLKKVFPRSLKPDIHLGQHIQFTEQEIMQVGSRMDSYLKDLCDAVESSGTS